MKNVIDRVKAGLCPICKTPVQLGKEGVVEMEFNGLKLCICGRHPYPGKSNE